MPSCRTLNYRILFSYLLTLKMLYHTIVATMGVRRDKWGQLTPVIYFRMHHFVVKFSKFSSTQAARGH